MSGSGCDCIDAKIFVIRCMFCFAAPLFRVSFAFLLVYWHMWKWMVSDTAFEKLTIIFMCIRPNGFTIFKTMGNIFWHHFMCVKTNQLRSHFNKWVSNVFNLFLKLLNIFNEVLLKMFVFFMVFIWSTINELKINCCVTCLMAKSPHPHKM